MITVYIVDDHPYVREGLKAFFNVYSEITVVGEAGTCSNAVRDIIELRPDVAVLDMYLSDGKGTEIVRSIAEAGLGTKVLILSSFSRDEDIFDAIRSGAVSYLLKDSPPEKLIEAIFAAVRGESAMHPEIIRKLMQQSVSPKIHSEQLTPKENDVLKLMKEGHSNKEIGLRLYISETTVKTHVSSILRKMDVKDRTQAVIRAMEEDRS